MVSLSKEGKLGSVSPRVFTDCFASFATVRMLGFSLKWAFIRRVKRGDMMPWRVETQNVSAVKQKHNWHLGNKN